MRARRSRSQHAQRWERGRPARHANRARKTYPFKLPPRGRGAGLIRVHRLSSLCARRARFFALTPSPSPTLWERGVGAHGGAPCSAFPLSRRRERGTKGVRAIQRTCRFTLALGKIAPASKTSCRTVVPLPGGAGDEGNQDADALHPVNPSDAHLPRASETAPKVAGIPIAKANPTCATNAEED